MCTIEVLIKAINVGMHNTFVEVPGSHSWTRGVITPPPPKFFLIIIKEMLQLQTFLQYF